MRLFWYRVCSLISAKLGRCPRCWRLSLRGAALGWVAAAAFFAVVHTGRVHSIEILWPLLLAWPASFTALWLLHIVTFGARSIVWERRRAGESVVQTSAGGGTAGSPTLVVCSPTSRRHMLRVFAKAATLAFVMSASPLLTSTARAYGSCNGQWPFDCGVGTRCAPDGTWCCSYRYLSYCDCRCYEELPPQFTPDGQVNPNYCRDGYRRCEG